MMELSIGPLLFHWTAEQKRDFYFRIADEAEVERVYLGEVICAKRAPFFEQYYGEVAERLKRGGKRVIFSTLSEVMTRQERDMVSGICELDDMVEANETAALYQLKGRAHAVGPYVNVYNEHTMAHLASRGAVHFTLPAEMPAGAIAVMSSAAKALDVTTEVTVWGRIGLALAARCYHARAYGRVKDNCQYACEADADGMTLSTLDGSPFLVINGIQTLSYRCVNLVRELSELEHTGIDVIRISPQECDVVAISGLFRRVMDGELSAEEARSSMSDAYPVPFANGFYHGTEGHRYFDSNQIAASDLS